jgi:hypothetical protein
MMLQQWTDLLNRLCSMSQQYEFECDLCTDPRFYSSLSDSVTCLCGRAPARYRDQLSVYCYLHRKPMTLHYLTSPSFLMIDYVTSGQQHLFPNAILYPVPDPPAEDDENAICILYCEECEALHHKWMTEHA